MGQRSLNAEPVVNVSANGRPDRLDAANGGGLPGSLLTAGDVAALLGVPVSWVYAQSRRGGIPSVTLGRYRPCRREAIEDWLRDNEERTGAPARA